MHKERKKNQKRKKGLRLLLSIICPTQRGALHPDLISAIEDYLEAHNSDPKIFTWTKDADTILAKVAHCKEALETLH